MSRIGIRGVVGSIISLERTGTKVVCRVSVILVLGHKWIVSLQ